MFQKYFILGVVQILLFIFVMPLVVGFFAGLFGKQKAEKKVWYIAGGLIALINVAVLIDKGMPFFTGHLIDAYMYTPFPTGGKMLVGLFGDAVLLVSFRSSLLRGIRAGMRFVDQPKPKKKAKA